jgi:hypothetical protein
MKKIVFVYLSLLSCYITYSQLPDSDGDGVVDSEDVCPFEKGVKENKGCPLQSGNQNKLSQTTEFLKAENLNQVIDQLCNDKLENFKYPGYKNNPGEVILTTLPKNGLANNLDVYYKTNGKGGYQVFLPLSEKETDFNAVLKQVSALSEKSKNTFCSFYGFTFNINRTNDTAFAVVAVMDKETTWQMGLYKHLSTPGKKIVLLSIVKFKSESSKNENGKNEGYINSNEFLNGDFSKTSNNVAPVQNNGVVRKSIGVIFDSMPANRILIVAKGGPADKAGFKPGDEVVKINSNAVQVNKEFINYVRNLDDKEHVFEVKRGKEVKTLKIKKADISSFTQKCLSGDCKNGQGAFVYSNFEYYEGGFKNSKKNGKGLLLLNDGGKYKGGFKNDYYFGEGVLSTPDGSSFTGTFDTVPVNGSGMLNYSNGNRYYGRVENKKLTGEGEYWYNNGNHYAGDFINSQRNGRGTMIWVSGDKYTGDFSNDKITGQGEYSFNDGRFYSGDFVDGKKQGKGEFTWPSGAKYTGDFSDDNLNGTGKYKEANGNLYVGKFKDGKKHGEGKYWDESVPGDWKVNYGTWENGVLVAQDGVALNNNNSNNNSGNNNQQNNSSQQYTRMTEDATTARIKLYDWLRANHSAREADIIQCRKDRGYGASIARMSGHCKRAEQYIKELNDKCYTYLKEYEKYTPASHINDIKTIMREASDGLNAIR